MKASIRLPWPPSVNDYWFSTVVKKRVCVFIGAKGKAFRAQVAAAVWERWPGLRATGAKVAVTLVVHPPDRRKRDLDNLPKAVLDALTKSRVWADDSQITGLALVFSDIVPGGAIDVEIELVEGAVRHLGWERVGERQGVLV